MKDLLLTEIDNICDMLKNTNDSKLNLKITILFLFGGLLCAIL